MTVIFGENRAEDSGGGRQGALFTPQLFTPGPGAGREATGSSPHLGLEAARGSSIFKGRGSGPASLLGCPRPFTPKAALGCPRGTQALSWGL